MSCKNKEIERVFIKQGEFPKDCKTETCKISDIYFTKHIRVRREVTQYDLYPKSINYYITFKFNTSNKLVRKEYEYFLNEGIGKFLFKFVNKQMHKERTHYIFKGEHMESNRYLNVPYQQPLVEIEFDTEEDAKSFNKKRFSVLGEEVTGMERVRNYNLYNRCREGVRWHI